MFKLGNSGVNQKINGNQLGTIRKKSKRKWFENKVE